MTCRPPLGCGPSPSSPRPLRLLKPLPLATGAEFCWRCLANYENSMRNGNHHQTTCQYCVVSFSLIFAMRTDEEVNAAKLISPPGSARSTSVGREA